MPHDTGEVSRVNDPIIFLDIDGVLNRMNFNPTAMSHTIQRECVEHLNRIIEETGAKVVISSAWRYLILGGAMTCDGFAYMLRTHGLIDGKGLIVGHTNADADYDDDDMERPNDERASQVTRWRIDNDHDGPYVVIDDCDYGFSDRKMPFIRTRGDLGLMRKDADKAIAILKGETHQ